MSNPCLKTKTIPVHVCFALTGAAHGSFQSTAVPGRAQLGDGQLEPTSSQLGVRQGLLRFQRTAPGTHTPQCVLQIQNCVLLRPSIQVHLVPVIPDILNIIVLLASLITFFSGCKSVYCRILSTSYNG